MKEKLMIQMGLKGGKNLVKIIFTLSLLFLFLEGYSQKEAYTWYFGRKAGLDFNTTPPTMLSNSPNTGNLDTDEAHATISDKNGNLLFYTNGQTIWNKNLVAMPNGTGLSGHWSTTQCATVFPLPGSTTEYFVITTPLTGTSTELLYSRVDMTAAAGLGDIKAPVASNKNQAMPSCPTYMMESVVSVPHFNGTDIWVIAHTADDPGTVPNEGGSFVVWLVTSAGIAYSNTYTLGYAYPYDNVGGVSRGIGIMKSNSCFTRIFISYYNASSRVEGFSFSNSTGVVGNWPAPVSAPLVLDDYRNSGGTMTPIGSFSYGLEISPNGRYLYNTISGETGNKELTQYDLQAATGTNAAIENSCVRLTPAAADGVRYSQLQLGPDGKIYHSIFNWNNIGGGGYCKVAVINSPNSAGAAANYVESVYVWPASATGVGSSMGLTSFHKGFISGRAAITSSLDNLDEVCLGDVLDLTAQSSGNISTYAWNIDKNLNNVVDYSTGPTINHTYGAAGNYTVELVVTDACGYTYTSTSPVIVLPKPTSAGTVTCSPVRGNVTAPNGSYTYVWYSDAAGTNPIGTGTTNVNLPVVGTGNVYVKAVSGASSTPNALTNGPSDAHPWGGSDLGTTHTMGFSVNKAPLTFGSFEWEAPYGAWAAADQNTTFSVVLKNTTTNTVYYTNNRTVATNGPTWVNGYPFTETVNQSLPIGNYSITITATSGVGGPIKMPATCSGSTTDSKGALTYGTSGICGIASSFSYTYTQIGTTALACSQMSAAIPFSCLLPVEFLSFIVTKSGSDALLQWSTAQEVNNNYFQLERSSDGINFYTIDRIKGAGNSSTTLTYKFTDTEISGGIIYYRIKQVDYDGAFDYSAVRYINFDEALSFSMAPNPSNGEFTIYINSGDITDTYKVEVSNVLGVITYEEEKATTDNTIKMSLQHLSKGVYLVRLIGNDANYIDKIVIE